MNFPFFYPLIKEDEIIHCDKTMFYNKYTISTLGMYDFQYQQNFLTSHSMSVKLEEVVLKTHFL